MFTTPPELRPYSALSVWLSTLNSETVLTEGWNVIWFLDLVVEVDAVDHEVHGVFAVAGGVEGERALSPQRRGQEAGLARRDRAGDEQPHVHEVAAVERDLLHRALVDDLAHGRGGASITGASAVTATSSVMLPRLSWMLRTTVWATSRPTSFTILGWNPESRLSTR